MTKPVDNELNLRAPSWHLVHAVTACGRCSEPIAVFALGLFDGYEVMRDEGDGGGWLRLIEKSLLFQIEYLDSAVGAELARLAPTFRQVLATEDGSGLWLNHCAYCGAAQEDSRLHGEPEGGFMPATVEEAAGIQCVRLAMPLTGRVYGYAQGIEVWAAAEALE